MYQFIGVLRIVMFIYSFHSTYYFSASFHFQTFQFLTQIYELGFGRRKALESRNDIVQNSSEYFWTKTVRGGEWDHSFKQTTLLFMHNLFIATLLTDSVKESSGPLETAV